VVLEIAHDLIQIQHVEHSNQIIKFYREATLGICQAFTVPPASTPPRAGRCCPKPFRVWIAPRVHPHQHSGSPARAVPVKQTYHVAGNSTECLSVGSRGTACFLLSSLSAGHSLRPHQRVTIANDTAHAYRTPRPRPPIGATCSTVGGLCQAMAGPLVSPWPPVTGGMYHLAPSRHSRPRPCTPCGKRTWTAGRTWAVGCGQRAGVGPAAAAAEMRPTACEPWGGSI